MKGRNILLPVLALLVSACIQAPRTTAPQGQGVLNISVKWPTLQTMAMPLETRSLRVAVKKGDTVLKTQDMARDSGQTSNLRMVLKADSGLDVIVSAYRDTYPSSSSVVIAEASASNVVLVPSQVTSLPLHLTPIESARQLNITLSSQAALQGGYIAIKGLFDENFTFDPNMATPSITFNGVSATQFLPATDSLLVRVPSTATTGRIMVQFDGRHTATSSAPVLWVARSFVLSAPLREGDSDGVRFITASESLTITPLIDWAFAAGEDESTYASEPMVEWLSAAPSVGSPDMNGLFMPLATGTTAIFGFIDTLVSSPSMLVNVVPAP